MNRLIACLALGAVAMTSSMTMAAFPERALTLIVTTAPGGPNDTVGRLVAGQLAEELGQPVVVENIAGAGGNVAAKRAAEATPDGYTLLLMSTSLTINPSLYGTVPYDPVASFRAIGLVGTSPHLIAASPATHFSNMGDVLAAARKSPGKLTYASGGNGTTSHLGMELLKSSAGVDILHVPYKGAGPAMIDAAAGRVDLVMFPLPSLESFVSSGKLVGLAVTDDAPARMFPKLLTAQQAGLPNAVVLGWWGVVAPVRTSREVTESLQKALTQALSRPKLQHALVQQGLDIKSLPGPAFESWIRNETTKWSSVVKTSGARVDN